MILDHEQKAKYRDNIKLLLDPKAESSEKEKLNNSESDLLEMQEFLQNQIKSFLSKI